MGIHELHSGMKPYTIILVTRLVGRFLCGKEFGKVAKHSAVASLPLTATTKVLGMDWWHGNMWLVTHCATCIWRMLGCKTVISRLERGVG